MAETISAHGRFAVTALTDTTLNGVLDDAKIQFLLADSQRVIEPVTVVAGLRVAGIGDLLATKLKVVSSRGELRDYFDLMEIERRSGRKTEEGLALFLLRYRPLDPDHAVLTVVRGLGYFGDVADDPQLPASRRAIERYWKRRQREIVANLDRHAGSPG